MLKSCTRGFSQTRWVLRGIQGRSRSLPPVRLSSTGGQSSGGSAAGKIALTGLIGITGIAGGTIGYASYDSEFRHYVEDMVPGARETFAAVLGEEEKKEPVKKAPVTAAPPSKLKPPPPIKVTSLPPKEDKPVEKKLESVPEKAKTSPVQSKPELALAPPPPLSPPPPPPPQQQAAKPAEEKSEPGQAENVSLEFSLEEACRTMEAVAELAVGAGTACTSSLRNHMALVQRVLEANTDDEKTWNKVFEAATVKTEAIKKANSSMDEARAAVKRVLETIEHGKKNEVTAENPSINAADKKVNDILIKLEQIKGSIEAAQKEAVAVEKYRDLIEEGRHQFQKEIAALLPHVNLSQKDGSTHLTEEELNLFMTHAYQKVCHLQQELARWKTLEQERAEQQIRSTVATEELVQAELAAQRRDLELEYQRRMSALRNEMENEMRGQLRRQAAAHSDHIADVLEVQQKELNRINERKMDEALTSERSAHKNDLTKILGKVNAIEKNIEDRAAMDEATRDAQALWLATVALNLALQNEEVGSVSLKQEVDKLASSFGNDEYVKAVLGGLPKEVTSNDGIPTEASIRDRFFRVEKLAQRTALVEEDGGSLLRYALSYLQSLFIISPSRTSMPDKNIPIDVESLSTFDIVWLARGSLERGDLEQAVKYMSLLKGMPRNVSRDWLKDARLVLETQLACRALLAHAAAEGVEVFPAK